MREQTCCFTGHRPMKLPWRYDETDPRCLVLKQRIRDAVEAAYQEGKRYFLCGMALGCDLYFAEAVIDLKRTCPDVVLEAAIPCPEQADRWNADQQERYRRLLAACDLETVVAEHYTRWCMQRRDQYMVDRASLLIAAFNGSPGGTRYTIQYAMKKGVDVVDLSIPGSEEGVD